MTTLMALQSGSWASGDPVPTARLRPRTAIVFHSWASNLVSGDTNGVAAIFLHLLATGETLRVSVTNAEGQANGSSDEPPVPGDGR